MDKNWQRVSLFKNLTDGVAHVVDFENLGGEEADVELTAQGIQNGANKQGAEQALGHGPQGVDAVALGGNRNVFPMEKFFHVNHLFHIEAN